MLTIIFKHKSVHVPKEAVKFCDKTICVIINLTVGQHIYRLEGTIFPFTSLPGMALGTWLAPPKRAD